MIGANAKWKNWEFDVEFYQKNSQGVLEQALAVNNVNNPDSTQRPPSFILYDGKGQTKGMDFFIQHTGKYFTGMVAYTLSKSTNQFKEIGNGISFPSSNDRRHQLKINGNLRLGRFDFFATYNFASGKPYTDLSKILENNDKTKNNPKPKICIKAASILLLAEHSGQVYFRYWCTCRSLDLFFSSSKCRFFHR